MPTRLLYAAGCAALLAGCQSMSADTAAPTADPMASAPPITRGFDAAGLSQVLLSEMAGQRGDFHRAATGYLAAAERYRSAALAERATLAARYTDDTGLLATTASRWQQYAPDDSAPEELLSGIAIDRGDWPGALSHRLELARDGQQARLLELVELAIEARTPLSPLRDQLQAFLATHPTQLDAQLAMARLEAAGGEADAAQQRLARLTRTHAAEPQLWLTRAQIAIEAGDNAQAAALARRGQALAPDDSRFVLALAQAEIAAGDLDAAETQVNRLLAEHDNTPSLRLGLAQLYLEAGALDPAKRLLLPLLDRDATPPTAYLLLGTIAEGQDEPDNALLYYRQVAPGPGFAESRALAIQMLVAAGRFDDAENFVRIESLRHPRQRALLTQIGVQALDAADESARADALLADSLARDPDNSDLLYSRAMRGYAQGDVDAMIATLRDIIAREPDNAAALNALGYTLTTDSDRYDEAFGLIQRAHQLEPQNPAILDSLGWVYFKRGDSDKALGYLRRAYAGQPDQEVAAHLAEVLAAKGLDDEARALVARALAASDEHPDIDALLSRYPRLTPSPASDSTGRPDDTSVPNP